MNQHHPPCYGKMFPNLLQLQLNKLCRGAVFSVQLDSAGIGVQSSEMQIDQEKWDECTACPGYRECYDLSAGTFMVQPSIWQR